MIRNTLVASLIALAPSVPPGAATEARPNILFIMADDHAAQAIGAYGGRLAELNPTPEIDRLAREGVLFTNAFCNDSLCTPSRASIMTGQYAHTNGVTDLTDPLPARRQYLAIEMKRAGYQTAVIGKWHLKGRPEAFDHYQVLDRQGEYFNPTFFVKGREKVLRLEGHSTDVITDSALDWLRDERDPDRPFFLKLHFKAPHSPFQSAPRYGLFLDDVRIPEPKSLRQRGTGSIATRGVDGELDVFLGSSVAGRNRFRGWLTFSKTKEAGEDPLGAAYQDYLKRYLRCVKGVDDNVGRVLRYLREADLLDDTLILYTGDQGFFLGEHDYIDKRWGYDEAMRMPLIVRFPRAIAPRRSDAIIENIDFPVTMLDYAGVPRPDYMQGRSFRPILEDGVEPEGWKQAAYYQYWTHLATHFNPGHVGMRTKRYKLILFHGVDYKKGNWIQTPAAWELYDLESDPHELQNRYDDPEYARVVEELKAQFAQLRADTGADSAAVAADVNRVIDEYWDYDAADRARAEAVSHRARAEFEAFTPKKDRLIWKPRRR